MHRTYSKYNNQIDAVNPPEGCVCPGGLCLTRELSQGKRAMHLAGALLFAKDKAAYVQRMTRGLVF